MNETLKKEIIKHIFDLFGIEKQSFQFGSLVKMVDDSFLIDKKIAFRITDEDKKVEGNIYSIITNVSNSSIKIILADISEEYEEFAFVLQMDDFSPCAIRLSSDEEDMGSVFFNIENNWIAVGAAEQAKILIAVENICSIFPKWEKLKDYKIIYKYLINFLNFYESNV